MQAEIKRHCNHADYCSCTAHSLNSVGELASSCCIESANCFIVNELHNFLAPTYHWKFMADILDPLDLTFVKKLSGTRSA